jgi:hydroxymethylpyrimidine pyrophosphatase-like HAD family hydrolase
MQTCDEGALAPYHIADFAGVFRSGSQIDKDVPGICLSNRGLVEKINFYFRKQSEQEAFIAMATRLPLTLSTSIGIGCELSPPGVTKSSGLETLCRHLSIPLASVMAVGDGGNDLDIMGIAGLSVAMGNAIEPVKALAHTMTEDNDHDGAARAIERYVL